MQRSTPSPLVLNVQLKGTVVALLEKSVIPAATVAV